MEKGIISILFIFIASMPLFAQQKKVESSAYNLMLKMLLSHDVDEISAGQAKIINDVIFIDSREKREYEVSHIKNAIWCGYNNFDMERINNIPKDQKIIIYCAVGARSEKIAKKLIDAGYTDVSNLYGGIFEWKNQKYPVYNSTGLTDSVHAYSRAWGIWLNEGIKVYE